MREVDLIHRQVELVAASIGARVRRLQDALKDLSFLTLSLMRHVPVAPGAVAGWLEAERFEALETGFFEQRDRVERARVATEPPRELMRCWAAAARDVPGVAEHFYVLRDLVSSQAPPTEAAEDGLTHEEVVAIRRRLQSLGYLED